MIRFACPTCNATFTVGDDKAGKTSNCPKCKSAFQIPELDPPPSRPASKPPQPREDIDEDERPRRSSRRRDEDDEDDDRPRRRPRREEDDDDRPRRSSRRRDEDDHPRRRARREDEDDDRPRRRREVEDDDEDDQPRRKKKKTSSGMILAAGIVLILGAIGVGVFAIHDISDFSSSRVGEMKAPKDDVFRKMMPKEMVNALDQIEFATTCFQIYMYSGLPAAIAMLAAGIGLVIHMTWGRVVAYVGGGLGVLSFLALIVFFILINTVSINGKGIPIRTAVEVGWICRGLLLVGPTIFAMFVLMNSNHTRYLRSKL